ncbi:MAG: hypothetical protein RL154_547, partial [Pseudomonadota bacterium]
MKYLDKIDAFFANKRVNDKRILFITPTLLVVLFAYQFEIPAVQKAQQEKKLQISELENASLALKQFIQSA